jgi:opacity protein-like surface antigen
MRGSQVGISMAALCVAVLACAVPARADGFVTPFYGYNFGGDSNCPMITGCEDKRANFGVSFGSMGTVFGFEEDIAFAKDFFGTIPNVDNSVFTAMSSLLVGLGKGPVQPYVVAGAGLIRTHTSLNPTQFNADGNSLGYVLGAGVNGYFTRHIGVRGDVRHLQTLQDLSLIRNVAAQVFVNQKLDFWRASVGLSLRF